MVSFRMVAIFLDQFKLAASYVDRILKGAKPATSRWSNRYQFDSSPSISGLPRRYGLTIPLTAPRRTNELLSIVRRFPFLALSGHPDRVAECPLSGEKRTSKFKSVTSAVDPKQTFTSTRLCRRAQPAVHGYRCCRLRAAPLAAARHEAECEFRALTILDLSGKHERRSSRAHALQN